MKGDKMAKISLGNMTRTRLSDITNSIPLPKSPDKLPADATSVKEYIDNLVMEKMALLKLIQEKNKILELSGNEIQNLRTCLQKMQTQNWNLAKSNSQMLAELNLGKDKLKTFQHELSCKEALLKTKSFELLRQRDTDSNKNELQEPTEMITIENGFTKDSKTCKANKRQTSRRRSLGCSAVCQLHAEKEAAVGNKRRCLRRQSCSTSLGIEHQEPSEDLDKTDGAKVAVARPSNSSNHDTEASSCTDEEVKDIDHDSKCEAGISRRSSILRPSRRAADKVQSYREVPLNIKMRRPE